jgi:hypothetical protein
MSFTTPYGLTAEITDKVVASFVTASDSRLAYWRTECDTEVESVCEQRGVSVDTFKGGDATEAHAKVQEYWRACFCRCVCRDNIGANNVETAEDEKYRIKYDIYRTVCAELRTQLTQEMFLDTVDSSNPLGAGRVGGGVLWRG